MPNCYFTARRLWVLGQRGKAVQSLSQCLADTVGGSVFEPNYTFMESPHLSSFHVAVSTTLADGKALRNSFGRVFSALWELHPSEIWIGTLLTHDFYSFLHRYGFDPELVDTIEQVAGFDWILNTLERAAVRGLLAPDYKGPNNGRAVLRLDDIRNVNDEHWGRLKPELLKCLSKAYAACPADFWRKLVAIEPEEVVFRAMHDLFLEYDQPIETGESKWRAIVRDQSAYANAVIDSTSAILNKNYSSEFLTTVARIDAGFFAVTDGANWISAFDQALRAKDFSILANVS